MVKLTRKYKKKNSRSKSIKKHKVSKKSRKSRNKKIIHIKKNSRKRRRIGGGSDIDGESDDEELFNIESGISRNKSISGDSFDIESGRESITPVITRKIKIPSAKPSPTARTQSPFVSIFSRFSGSLGDLTKSISPYPRKTSNISPNISSSSADSEEGGVTNTSVPLPKYDLPFSGVEVHTDEYQAYLTNPSIKRYKPMAPLVFESQQKRFSKFLDNSGYTGSEKEELMNKLTDPDFIHHLDIFINKMSNTQKSNLNRQEELFEATQKNARESLRKDIEEKIKSANK
jgi:hypothetical protein